MTAARRFLSPMATSWLMTGSFTAMLTLLPPPAPTPIPDVLLPGHKPVQHELVLEWNTAELEHRFVAFPVRGFHGHTVIEPGQPFSFSSKYGTAIYALPSGAAVPSDRTGFENANWAGTGVPVGEVGSVPIGNPLTRLETVLRVTGVGEAAITFERVREQRFDANGNVIGQHDVWWLALFAAAGATLLAFVVVRQRANTPTNPHPA
ncbi:MAG: hypothetical protein NXI31_08355 [bacterium]|nr:hypothetical protein [bacterium]